MKKAYAIFGLATGLGLAVGSMIQETRLRRLKDKLNRLKGETKILKTYAESMEEFFENAENHTADDEKIRCKTAKASLNRIRTSLEDNLKFLESNEADAE